MKRIQNLSLIMTLIIECTFANAQVKFGANPTTITAGQFLELEKTGNKAGLKLASVDLSSTTDIVSIGIPSTAVGTMAYNTGSTGLSTPGIYVWSGSVLLELQQSQILEI